MRRAAAIALAGWLAGACTAPPRAEGAASKRDSAAVEWTAYGHDAEGTKYSPAAQITRINVARLAPAWTYRTGDYGAGGSATRDETTPLYVDGVLYASTPFGGVRAIDGETGRELWAFDSELDLEGDYGDFTNRGVSTWVDASTGAAAPCHRRIYVAPVDARVIALDARTGTPCADFGEHGEVKLNRDLVNAPEYAGEYAITSPPAVFRDLLIVGSSVSDNHRAAAPSGVVRAFDARTGAQRWAWDPIARTPKQPGYDTWRGPNAHRTGAANAWSIITVDAERDLVFIPVGSASPDFYGGERLGQNLFANSVVALRGSTGRMVWHFQAVHHDLWDYDVPAQPVLFTMHRAGRKIPALAQATKMGFLFILDRETGAPLFPVTERPVPKSDVPGEDAWPTQPVPSLPAPLGPTRFTIADVFGVDEAGRASCRAQLAGVRMDGIFTPPSLGGSVLFPGNIGGSNWSGVSIDPVRQMAFAPSNRVITLAALVPRAEAREVAMHQGRLFEMAPQAGTPFAMKRHTPLQAADGVPCNPPPWGVLTAIDLETGAKRWEVPFGRIAALSNIPGSASWGSPNLGGSMVTAGGLVFAGGALDQRLHAYDVETGTELWWEELPAGVHAAPMTYTTASGRQFVVVAAGGHKDLHDRAGDYIAAFALSDGSPPMSAAPTRITPGRYAGHFIFDRTWTRTNWDLAIMDTLATLTFATERLALDAHGTGRVAGDSLRLDVLWRYPEKNCGGTMRLTGRSANGGTAIIGDVDYIDGCNHDERKAGTFAVYIGPRRTTSLPY